MNIFGRGRNPSICWTTRVCCGRWTALAAASTAAAVASTGTVPFGREIQAEVVPHFATTAESLTREIKPESVPNFAGNFDVQQQSLATSKRSSSRNSKSELKHILPTTKGNYSQPPSDGDDSTVATVNRRFVEPPATADTFRPPAEGAIAESNEDSTGKNISNNSSSNNIISTPTADEQDRRLIVDGSQQQANEPNKVEPKSLEETAFDSESKNDSVVATGTAEKGSTDEGTANVLEPTNNVINTNTTISKRPMGDPRDLTRLPVGILEYLSKPIKQGAAQTDRDPSDGLPRELDDDAYHILRSLAQLAADQKNSGIGGPDISEFPQQAAVGSSSTAAKPLEPSSERTIVGRVEAATADRLGSSEKRPQERATSQAVQATGSQAETAIAGAIPAVQIPAVEAKVDQKEVNVQKGPKEALKEGAKEPPKTAASQKSFAIDIFARFKDINSLLHLWDCYTNEELRQALVGSRFITSPAAKRFVDELEEINRLAVRCFFSELTRNSEDVLTEPLILSDWDQDARRRRQDDSGSIQRTGIFGYFLQVVLRWIYGTDVIKEAMDTAKSKARVAERLRSLGLSPKDVSEQQLEKMLIEARATNKPFQGVPFDPRLSGSEDKDPFAEAAVLLAQPKELPGVLS